VTLRDARTAKEDRDWIRKVYRDYLSELSASKTGIFPALGEWSARESEFLTGWFAEVGAYPFVILNSGERAGFALVTRSGIAPRPAADFRMSEFFVLGSARRRGVGASAATLLFHRFAGDWEVVEDEHNRPALLFWRRVITGLTAGRYSETRSGGEVRHRFRIESRPPAGRA
jgi:predicted acetyltransferase